MVLTNDNPKKQTIVWIFKAIACFLQQHPIKTIIIGDITCLACSTAQRTKSRKPWFQAIFGVQNKNSNFEKIVSKLEYLFGGATRICPLIGSRFCVAKLVHRSRRVLKQYKNSIKPFFTVNWRLANVLVSSNGDYVKGQQWDSPPAWSEAKTALGKREPW